MGADTVMTSSYLVDIASLVQFSHHRSEGVSMAYRRLSALVTVATLAFGGTFIVAPLFLPESATVVKADGIGPNSTRRLNELTDGYGTNAATRILVALGKGVNDALNIYEETSIQVGGLKEGKTVAVGFTGVYTARPGRFTSVDELETFSGWIDPKNSEGLPKSKINGFLSPATLVPIVQNIIKALSVYDYSGKSNSFLDQGVPGRYYASHAEKQMLAELESGLGTGGTEYGGTAAISVSRPMCTDCQYFYAFEARRIAKDFVVGGASPGEAGDPGPSNRDPIRRVARYFHADGRVDVISRNQDGSFLVKVYSAAEVDCRYDEGLNLD
jgi:hypothetical protein